MSTEVVPGEESCLRSKQESIKKEKGEKRGRKEKEMRGEIMWINGLNFMSTIEIIKMKKGGGEI